MARPIKKVSKKYGIPESEFTINIMEMMPTIMNILDRSLADKALTYLQNKNIIGQAKRNFAECSNPVKKQADSPEQQMNSAALAIAGINSDNKSKGDGGRKIWNIDHPFLQLTKIKPTGSHQTATSR